MTDEQRELARRILDEFNAAGSEKERWDVILKYREHVRLFRDNDYMIGYLKDHLYDDDNSEEASMEREELRFQGWVSGAWAGALFEALGIEQEYA